MQEPRSWQDVLHEVIRDPKELARIASEVGVQPRTLQRWASRESTPQRLESVRRLLLALPKHRDRLRDLLLRDFPDLLRAFEDEPLMEIPQALISRVVRGYAMYASTLQWTIQGLVLPHMVRHLDPDRVGVAALLVMCTPPQPGQPVVSLMVNHHAESALGTLLWEQQVVLRPALLDGSSCAGRCIEAFQPVVLDQAQVGREDLDWLHAREAVQSMGAYPLFRLGRIAGCLLLVGTQPTFFPVSSPRSTLIENYAHLLALSFADQHFYAKQDIALSSLPPPALQQTLLTLFSEHVLDELRRGQASGRHITWNEAERIVHQRVESTLRALSQQQQQDTETREDG